MGSLGNWAENALLNWCFTNDTAPTRPTAWWVSLHTADPGETGTSELADTGYARQQVTNGFSTSTAGAVENEAAITWTNSSGSSWTAVVGFGIWDDDGSPTGNYLGGGTFSSKTIANGDTATFAIGALDITLD
jgi:hypothetical protein